MGDIMRVITKVQLRHQPGAADRGLARGAGHLQAQAGPRGGAEAEQVVRGGAVLYCTVLYCRSCEAGLDSAPADLGLQLPASSLPLLPASPRPAPASSSVSDFLEDPLAVLRQVTSSDTGAEHDST